MACTSLPETVTTTTRVPLTKELGDHAKDRPVQFPELIGMDPIGPQCILQGALCLERGSIGVPSSGRLYHDARHARGRDVLSRLFSPRERAHDERVCVAVCLSSGHTVNFLVESSLSLRDYIYQASVEIMQVSLRASCCI